MKRVCHVTTTHAPFDVRIFHRECKTLCAAGYEVTLVAPHERDECVEGIRILALPKYEGRLRRMIVLSSRAFLRALTVRAHLYHFHEPELLPAGMLLKLTGAKVIYDVHEDYPKQILNKAYLPRWMRRPISILVKRIEGLASRLLDGIITATESIETNFASPRKVSVHNFPILDQFANGAGHDLEGRGNDAVFRLIYAGGIEEVRGISHLIQALKIVNTTSSKRAQLTLLGPFDPPGYREKIEKMAGYENVRYLGRVAPPVLFKMMQHFHAGVVCLLPLSNYLESMPIKLFEYMAAGLPVIASDFPAWRRIVEDAGAGLLVDPLKPADIAAAIIWLMDHPEQAAEMGRQGREKVMTIYNWRDESRKLLRFYETMIGKGAVEAV